MRFGTIPPLNFLVRPHRSRSIRERLALLQSSGMFDAEWYRRTYSDAAASRLAPLEHFARHGSKELRDPGPEFNSKWYFESYSDVREGDLEPVFHYLSIGKAQNRQIRASSAHARQLDPKSAAGFSRRRELVLASGFLDRGWYLRKYRDVAAAGLDPLDHFVEYGSPELRDPGPQFEAKWYLDEHPEVEESGLEPIYHYIEIGRAHGYATKGPPPYTRWRTRFDTLSDNDIAAIQQHIESVPLPKLTVAFVFDHDCERSLLVTAAHLRDQLYSHWSAIFFMTSDCSRECRSRAGEIAAEDSRIATHDVPTGADLVAALPDEGVVFARGGVLFRRHALYMFASYAADAPQACIIYSDEDRIDEEGTPIEPVFKPAHSPLLFTQERYHENCFFLRVVRAPASSASIYEFSDGHFVSALFKSAVANGVQGVHIPFVLSHDTNAPPGSAVSTNNGYRDELNALPRVSIIIPTKDRLDLLEPCLTSLEAITGYPAANLEIVVVDNGSVEQSTLAYLEQRSADGRLKWLRHSDVFNFSRLNNLAALNSSGEVLVFMNNDIEIIDPLWLKRLVAYAIRPELGAIGAKLLYPDRTVQHAGVVLGIQGVAAHSHVGIGELEPGYNGLNQLTREVAAVTGACLAMRRSVFFELGGFDCDLAVAFNDTVLCLAARSKGYQNVWVSDAILIHHESKSRGLDTTPERKIKFMEEARTAISKHPVQFQDDPFYNPNLSLQSLYELASPPRVLAPWRRHARKHRKPRVLMLSTAHRKGYGVAVVVQLQAVYLAEAGFEVFIGGPGADDEMPYTGCSRVVLKTPNDAANFAVENEIDCVVAHTPPFFSVVRFLGPSIPVIFYDYGEPPAEFFPDSRARIEVNIEKKFSASFATRLLAISEAIRVSANEPRMTVVPLGNSHLSQWDESLIARRSRVRDARGWEGKTVVLNVCRFFQTERFYKGVGQYADLAARIRMRDPDSGLIFVLCGRASKRDVAEVKAFGIEVYASVPDEELVDLYCAADIYANFSKWEGYNLGIGQALAMGLPVLASDIPAHRAFPIFTSGDTDEITRKLIEMHERIDEVRSTRRPVLTEWEPSHAQFAGILKACIAEAAESDRLGRYPV